MLEKIIQLREAFGNAVTWQKPRGGLFLWCTLPEGLDGADFCKRAGARKVTCVPGQAFTVGGTPTGAIRINFSLPDLEQIREGCVRLKAAFEEESLS